MATPPAGWYPDPELVNTRRYWDGAKWTEHRQEQAASQGPTPPAVAGSSSGSMWKWIGAIVVAIILAVVALQFLGVLGGATTWSSIELANEIEAGLEDKGVAGADLTCSGVGSVEQGDVTICDGEDGDGNPVMVKVTFNSDGSYLWETQ